MKKDIFTMGFEIPGFSDLENSFSSDLSLMDADIIAVSPKIVSPSEHGWVSFSSGGGGCYDVATSKNFIKKSEHLKKEVSGLLKIGKTVILFLSKKTSYLIATGVSHPRKGQNKYSTRTASNYDFLPINIGELTSASGNKISFTGNQVFWNFNRNFSKHLAYKVYIEGSNSSQVIYTGKDKAKVLAPFTELKMDTL